MRSTNKARSHQGQALALPLVMLTLVVVGVIGMFSFEIARTALAKEQLQSATEAAALAAGAVLNGPEPDVNVKHQRAVSAAEKVFRANSLLGTNLSDAVTASGAAPINKARLQFRFIDRNNNNSTVSQGDPRANAVEVSTNFGLQTVTGGSIGLGNAAVPVQAQAIGGSNNLDLVILFDSTISMKRDTKLSTVRRFLSNGVVNYTTTRSFRSIVGGARPQVMPQIGENSFNAALRGFNDNSKPGNSPETGNARAEGITDVVVNLDEQVNFRSFSQDGFDFPSVAVLVEASRGNLENPEVFESSGAASALRGVVTPRAGYQEKYFELALEHTHPLAEAKQAVTLFMNKVKERANVRVGLVTFQQEAGQTESSTFSAPNVSGSYPAGGQGAFPLPAIQLSQTNNKIDECNAALQTVTAANRANTGAAVDRALQMLAANGRAGSQKAIFVLTDSAPQLGTPFSGDPLNNCALAAREARQRGITISTLGLGQDSEEVSLQLTRNAARGSSRIVLNNIADLQAAIEFMAAGIARTSL